jgi:hypothetical protein
LLYRCDEKIMAVSLEVSMHSSYLCRPLNKLPG